METLSVVISAWNEEARIRRCLESVKWADEIVVIDSSSTDKTVSIARQFTKKIYHQPNNPMLNVNKNYGFDKATSNWILSVDADEEIPQELVKEIKTNIKHGDTVGYWLPRKNIIFGKWIQHGLWWPDKQLRLFRKGRGKFPGIHVHEYLVVDGPTADLTIPFVHYNYDSISQFIRKMNTLYTESEVQKHRGAHYQLSWTDAVRFPVSDFVKVYFAQEGYKDGLHGLVLSILQAFYSFIVFSKLWEKQHFTEIDPKLTDVGTELVSSGVEITYWMYDAKIKNTSNPILKLWYKVLRRYEKNLHSHR